MASPALVDDTARIECPVSCQHAPYLRADMYQTSIKTHTQWNLPTTEAPQ